MKRTSRVSHFSEHPRPNNAHKAPSPTEPYAWNLKPLAVTYRELSEMLLVRVSGLGVATRCFPCHGSFHADERCSGLSAREPMGALRASEGAQHLPAAASQPGGPGGGGGCDVGKLRRWFRHGSSGAKNGFITSRSRFHCFGVWESGGSAVLLWFFRASDSAFVSLCRISQHFSS